MQSHITDSIYAYSAGSGGSEVAPARAGGIVGEATDNSVISECIVNGTINSKQWAGGIVGYAQSCIISNNSVLGGSSVTGNQTAGGIAGYLGGDGESYKNYIVLDSLLTAAERAVGGIIGRLNSGTVRDCRAYTSIKGDAVYKGKIVGEATGSPNILERNYYNADNGASHVIGYDLMTDSASNEGASVHAPQTLNEIANESAGTAINEEKFPDSAFRSYITNNFDTDSNGYLSDAEIAAATGIYVNNKGITTLKGIEFFTALTELYCTGNQLTELDVSGNTALQVLYCNKNSLTSLVLGNNTVLAEVNCKSNSLTQIDITGCPNISDFTYDSGVVINSGNDTTSKPEFKTHSLLLSGQIGVNFYMDLPEISGVDYTDAYMDFSIAGDSSNPPQYFDSDFMNSRRTYYGFRCYIKSVQMADNISAVFHYGNNQTVTHEYSAEKYLNDSLAAKIPDTERALIEAIKDFGHYAQLYLSRVNGWSLGTAHKAIDCENEYSDSDIEAARQAVDGNAIVKDVPEDSGIKRVGFSLNLDADTTINLYIYPEDNYTGPIAAYIPGSTTNDAIYYSDRNRYKVEINNIPAHRLADTFTVRIAGKKEFDVKVSAFSYVNAALNDSNAQRDEINTVVSLYRYYTTNMAYRAANGL